jgi:lipoprotein NlpD
MTSIELRGAARLLAASIAVLAGCGSEPVQAPVSDLRPPAVRTPAPTPPAAAPAVVNAPAGYYVIKRGDTLYSIALENGADYRDVARWNKLDDPTKIAVGQMIRVAPPEGEATVQVGAAHGAGPLQARPLEGAATAQQVPADGGAKVAPKALRLPYSEENLAMLSKGEALPGAATPAPTVPTAPAVPAGPAAPSKSEPPKAAAVARDPDSLDFIWPAHGGLLAKFSEPNSKGVDIGGKSGDPVVAAAAGQVLYTGTGIRGFGKLIVIRHENGFSSVYAHNREILVKEGQNVSRGQRIAELGDSDADRPKLHFEIRKSGKPVDPLRYLPGDKPAS